MFAQRYLRSRELYINSCFMLKKFLTPRASSRIEANFLGSPLIRTDQALNLST